MHLVCRNDYEPLRGILLIETDQTGVKQMVSTMPGAWAGASEQDKMTAFNDTFIRDCSSCDKFWMHTSMRKNSVTILRCHTGDMFNVAAAILVTLH